MRRQFATFYLGSALFAVDVLVVREINRHLDITRVDPAPDFITGLMNLRGQIISVVDPAVRLGIERQVRAEIRRCIVLKTESELENARREGLSIDKTANDIIGLVVDGIGDMITVEDDTIEIPPANVHGVDGRFIRGVIPLASELAAVMNLAELLQADKEGVS